MMMGTTAARVSDGGTLVCLDALPSLDAALELTTAHGGHVAPPCQVLPPGMGLFAHIHDLHGNRIGPYAAPD